MLEKVEVIGRALPVFPSSSVHGQSWQTGLWNNISIFLLNIFSIQTCVATGLVDTSKRTWQTSARKPKNQCKHQQLCVSFLEAYSVASTVWKLCRRGLQVCALGRAISKPPFELGIGSICSWQASESANTWRQFWPWHNPFKDIQLGCELIGGVNKIKFYFRNLLCSHLNR